MQSWLSRVAALLRSDRPSLTSNMHFPEAPRLGASPLQRAVGAVTRLWDRWITDSSPQFPGEEKTQDVLVIGFCAAFSLIGWMMIMEGVQQLSVAREMERWPTAAGAIVSVAVQQAGDGEGTRWRPQITYTYQVGGHSVTATRITVGRDPSIKNEGQARDYVRKYLPQTPVRVYYNPDEITDSVLELGTPRSAHLNLTLGIALACVGPVLFLMIGTPLSPRASEPCREPLGLTPPSQQ